MDNDITNMESPEDSSVSSVETVGEQSQSTVDNSTESQQSKITEMADRNDRIFRHNAAQQRINRSVDQWRQRARKAETRLAQLEGSDRPEDIAEGRIIESQLSDYKDAAYAEARSGLENRVLEQYGDKANVFMSLVDKYADYVNESEPELLDYYNTPYGLLLMGEWFKRMEHPQYRQEWIAFGKFQKQQVLHNFYQQIVAIVEDVTSGSNVATQGRSTTPSSPVVTGGRQTETQATDTDFGAHVNDAFRSFGYK